MVQLFIRLGQQWLCCVKPFLDIGFKERQYILLVRPILPFATSGYGVTLRIKFYSQTRQNSRLKTRIREEIYAIPEEIIRRVIENR